MKVVALVVIDTNQSSESVEILLRELLKRIKNNVRIVAWSEEDHLADVVGRSDAG